MYYIIIKPNLLKWYYKWLLIDETNMKNKVMARIKAVKWCEIDLIYK